MTSIVCGRVLPLKGVLRATCIQMHTAAFLGTSATQTAGKEAVLAVGSLLKAFPAGSFKGFLTHHMVAAELLKLIAW